MSDGRCLVNRHITGLIAPPHTPMKADGSVDLDAIEPYAGMLAENGLRGAFVCGSTGESMSLSVQERLDLTEAWVEAAPDDFLVIVHAGHTALPDCKEIASHAQETGADAIAMMPPCYFKPQDIDDLVEFAAEVAAEAPDLPFYYYHIPVMTGVCLPMVNFLKVAGERIPNLAGMKFTHEDLMDYGRCLRLSGGRYDMLFGRDEILLSALVLGAKGAVGTTYNYAAPLYNGIMAAFEAGDISAAQAGQARATRLVAVERAFGGLRASKAIMKLMGLDCGPCRLPLRTLSSVEEKALRAGLAEIGFFDFCCKV